MADDADRIAIDQIIALLPADAQASARAAFRGQTSEPTLAAVQKSYGITPTAPSAPLQTQVGSPPMDATQPPATGGLTAVAAPAPASPAAAPALSLADLITQRQALGAQQQAAAQSAYDTAAAQLQQQRQRAQGGLSSAELLKIASAFLTPTRGSSFMGALGNVTPALGDIAQARETVAQSYPTQLAALRQKYVQDVLAAQGATLKDVTSPVEKVATLGKVTPRKMQLGSDNQWYVAPPVDDKGRRMVRDEDEAALVPVGQTFAYINDPVKTYYGRKVYK